MNQIPQGPLLRLPKVIQITGLGRSTIYKLVSAGTFPAPVKLSERAVAWMHSEVDKWVESRQRAR